jgi:hypothetical protein
MLHRDAVVLLADVDGDASLPSLLTVRATRIAFHASPGGVRDGRHRSENLPCTAVGSKDGLTRLVFGLGTSNDVVGSAEIIAPAGVELVAERRVSDMLACVFPATDQEFERIFIGRNLRWDDARSNYFVARQLCLHFPGSAHFRCAAAPVLCYKAAETDDPADTAEALEIAHALLPVAESCRRNWHPRKNGEHLYFALLTAIWHLHIARRDVGALLATLETIEAGMGRVTNYLTPSFNLCKSLLLYGYVLYRRGNLEKSGAMFRLVVETFKRGAADVDIRRVTLLVELAASHRAAVLAAAALRNLGGEGPADIDGDAILAECLRVGGKAVARLTTRLQADLAA